MQSTLALTSPWSESQRSRASATLQALAIGVNPHPDDTGVFRTASCSGSLAGEGILPDHPYLRLPSLAIHRTSTALAVVDRARTRVTPSGQLQDLTPHEIARSLSGNSPALRKLIAQLTPVVQGRVARVLLRSGGMRARGVSVKQEVEDLSQDVFEKLFASGGQVLRTWEPERGMSLSSFVGLVAERTTISTLRSRPRNPLTESPTESSVLELHTESVPPPDRAIATEQVTRTLLGRMKKSLSPLGFQVFTALFCDDKSTEVVGQELGLSPDAVYAWRHRIRKTALELASDLRDDVGPQRGAL